VASWCIPPEVSTDFVWHREDVIHTHMRPYDPHYPVVCFDETFKPLFGEVQPSQPPRLGAPMRVDYE
jgi:hypothetical protein